jgi:hypothetical protein
MVDPAVGPGLPYTLVRLRGSGTRLGPSICQFRDVVGLALDLISQWGQVGLQLLTVLSAACSSFPLAGTGRGKSGFFRVFGWQVVLGLFWDFRS